MSTQDVFFGINTEDVLCMAHNQNHAGLGNPDRNIIESSIILLRYK